MSITFDHLCLILLFSKPTAVVLYTCMGLGSWGCPSSSWAVRIGKTYLAFRKVVPISASADEDMTVLMSWHRVWMALLLLGRVRGLLPVLTSLSARKNGLWLGYVRVLHRYRTHHWQCGGLCSWHDSGVWLWGGLPHNPITK